MRSDLSFTCGTERVAWHEMAIQAPSPPPSTVGKISVKCAISLSIYQNCILTIENKKISNKTLKNVHTKQVQKLVERKEVAMLPDGRKVYKECPTVLKLKPV